MESALDLQFEVLTTRLNDRGKAPERGAINNADAKKPPMKAAITCVT